MQVVVILAIVALFIGLILLSLFSGTHQQVGDAKDKKSKNKYYLTVGAIFRNETHILESWLNHYLKEGVEHFYLVNDRSTDDYLSILQPYIDKGLVTLFHTDSSTPPDGQRYAYSELIYPKALVEAEWLAFLDLDEFLTTYGARSSLLTAEYLRNYAGNYNAIYVSWLMYGSGDYINSNDVPTNPIEAYRYRRRTDIVKDPYEIKTIFRPKAWKTRGVHKVDVYGNGLDLREHTKNIDLEKDVSKHPPLVVIHYHLQSKGYWYKIKKTRGDAIIELRLRTEREFDAKNETYNEVKDDILYNKNIPTINEH